MKSTTLITLLSSAAIMLSAITLQAKPRHKYFKTTDPEFFKTDIARQVGARILIYQRCTGGWPKNTDLVSPMTQKEVSKVLSEKSRTDDSTIDNFATTMAVSYTHLNRLGSIPPRGLEHPILVPQKRVNHATHITDGIGHQWLSLIHISFTQQ